MALFDQGRVTATATAPPVVGDVARFQVCSSSACDDFVPATARARVVANRVAIFVDTLAPAGGYTVPDLAAVGTLFDDFLYPIDTTAFGRESDIDANSVVIVLLTQRVNALSPDCNSTGSVILGYFFGADLLPRSTNNPGSNEAEIFYGLVPDPTNPDCDISEGIRPRAPAGDIHSRIPAHDQLQPAPAGSGRQRGGHLAERRPVPFCRGARRPGPAGHGVRVRVLFPRFSG